MIYKQLIPSGTTRFHIFFQHAHGTRFTCRRTCACCMLTTHAKTYSVLSIGSRRQNVQVTATDLELMLSSCGGQTVAASSIRDRHAQDARRTSQHAPIAPRQQRQQQLNQVWQPRIDLHHHQSCRTTTCRQERGGQKHVVSTRV